MTGLRMRTFSADREEQERRPPRRSLHAPSTANIQRTEIPAANDGEGAKIMLTDGAAAKLKDSCAEDGKAVVIGIRPEHIKVVKEAGEGTIKGTIDVSEMMGSEYYLHITAAGKDVVLRVPMTDLPVEFKAGVPYGSEINFTFPAELIHMFDPESEANMLK